MSELPKPVSRYIEFLENKSEEIIEATKAGAIKEIRKEFLRKFDKVKSNVNRIKTIQLEFTPGVSGITLNSGKSLTKEDILAQHQKELLNLVDEIGELLRV